jgi:diguanylate cyclase (GGDEF)-like protein/PAS domain S-box-containing protein
MASDPAPAPLRLPEWAAIAAGVVLVVVEIAALVWLDAVAAPLQARLGFAVVVLLAGVAWALLFRRFVRARREAEREAAEQRALARSESRFRALVQHASDLVTVLEPDGTVSYAAPSVSRILHREPSEVEGRRLVEFAHPEDAGALLAFLDRTPTGGETGDSLSLRLRRTDGSWVPVEALGARIPDDDGTDTLVLTSRDVSERVALEERLVHQTFHDALTGLANRELFTDRLAHALVRREYDPTSVAVLLLDLADFQAVNERFGHDTGDRLLRLVAARLREGLRPGDTAARLSADEFAVLLENVTGAAEASAIAERFLADLAAPVVVPGGEIVAEANVGIAVGARGAHGAEELLRNADLALHVAKRDGAGQVRVHEPQLHQAVLSRLELKADLQRAVHREEFVLHYQPSVALDGSGITGVEALVRWRHPTRGLVPPAEFIPLAEETGLIIPIGRLVLRRACEQARSWHETFPALRGMTMSVNVSGRQLEWPGLVDEVVEILGETGLDPATLVLEITESVVLGEREDLLARLRALKDLGLRLAIDDFGTGYSSLSYLSRLPVDILKIDKSFVDGLGGGEQAAALVATIIGLGRTLKLQTVAEGIEQPDQAAILRSLACDVGQGFLFARPLERQDVEDLLVKQIARGQGRPQS